MLDFTRQSSKYKHTSPVASFVRLEIFSNLFQFVLKRGKGVVMGFIIGALKIIVVLGTLITIHEAGHFFVAKACKVKVHKFAIGFGPKIFTKQGKETEYTLRLIPFGGFVQMEGEEEASEDARAFNKKPSRHHRQQTDS